jgi:CheY-like chemotaxis protein
MSEATWLRADSRTFPRVLLVDDEFVQLRMMRNVLVPAGYRVVPTATGRDALRHCAASHFDAVVIDVQMPGMSGVELARRVRSDPKHRDVPIVLAASMDEGIVCRLPRMMRSSVIELLPKPFDGRMLVSVLDRLTRRLRVPCERIGA